MADQNQIAHPDISVSEAFGKEMKALPKLQQRYITDFESELHMSSLDFFSMHYFRMEAEKALIELFEGKNFIKSFRLIKAIKNYYRPIKAAVHPPKTPKGIPIRDRVEEQIKVCWGKSKEIVRDYRLTKKRDSKSLEELYFELDKLLDEVYWARQRSGIGIRGTIKQIRKFKKKKEE